MDTRTRNETNKKGYDLLATIMVLLKNRFVAPARHLWVEKLPPVGYRRSYGRSDRLLIGGSDPVKKHGPGNFADVRVVTP
jgi:hypothetical protein